MLAGVALAVVAVVLYAFASVLQAIGARNVSSVSGRTPDIGGLVRQRPWVLGLALLVLAFSAFAASTMWLPLLLAVVIRAFYPVLTVVLEHAILATRVRLTEVIGAAIVLIGPVVIVASGGQRNGQASGGSMTLLMVALLLVLLIASSAAGRYATRHPLMIGVLQAVLSGVAFTVVDTGVRSLPSPFSLSAALATPACWVGAAAAPIGLLLFSRAAATVSAGLATVLLTVVNVVGSSAWSTFVVKDSSNAGPAQYGVAVAAAAVGLILMLHVPYSTARQSHDQEG